MIAPDVASAALAALWQAMVELAETANDAVVNAQAAAAANAATIVGSLAADLSILARAAEVLSRRASSPS